MQFAGMMHAISHWYRKNHLAGNDAFPLKVTFEAGNVDIAAEMFGGITHELNTILSPPIELGRPFSFMGILVEIKIRPRQHIDPRLTQRPVAGYTSVKVKDGD